MVTFIASLSICKTHCFISVKIVSRYRLVIAGIFFMCGAAGKLSHMGGVSVSWLDDLSCEMQYFWRLDGKGDALTEGAAQGKQA